MVTMVTHKANMADQGRARSVFVTRMSTQMLSQTAIRKYLNEFPIYGAKVAIFDFDMSLFKLL